MIFTVFCCTFLKVLVCYYICHIQMIRVHEFWDVYYKKYIEVRLVQLPVYFSSIDLSGFFRCTARFIFMLITDKEG